MPLHPDCPVAAARHGSTVPPPDQIDRFTDGVYFVDLVTATDSDAVLALIATAIGLDDAAERSPLDEPAAGCASSRS